MKKRPPDGAQALPRPLEFDIVELLRRASPVLIVVGVWLAFHPYVGIVHDSRLYVAQALHALHPDVFGADLFFAFGSQDDYTLFSRVFAPLVDTLGPSGATMLFVAASHALWLAGAAALAIRLAPDRSTALAGLVILAGLPAIYGGWQLIAYGESFATARLPAEAVSLWVLWALIDRRPALAAALVVVTAMLHPIVALTTLGVGFCFLVLRDWRWSILGVAGILTIAALTVAGIPPLDALARTMDPDWLAIVEQRNIFVFPSLWQTRDWVKLSLYIATAFAGSALVDGWRRKFILAAIAASLSGVLATYVGADLLHNVFVIQIQIWRTLWLLQAIAYLGAGVLVVRLWRLEGDGNALIALTLLGWLVGLMLNIGVGLAVAAAAYALAILRLRGTLDCLPRRYCIAIFTTTGLAIVALVALRMWIVADLMAIVPGEGDFMVAFGNISIIEGAAAIAVALLVARFFPDTGRTVLAVAALALIVGSAAVWDRRGEWTAAITANAPPPTFDAVLPENAQVYWENDVRGAWYLLRRPSYFSAAQGAGLLFRRETALEYRRRAAVIAPLLGRDPMASLSDKKAIDVPPSLPALTRADLAAACARDMLLDAMVLTRKVDGAYVAVWSLRRPIYDAREMRKGFNGPPLRDFYLYNCAALR